MTAETIERSVRCFVMEALAVALICTVVVVLVRSGRKFDESSTKVRRKFDRSSTKRRRKFDEGWTESLPTLDTYIKIYTNLYIYIGGGGQPRAGPGPGAM